MKKTFLSALILKSERPEELARFYRETLDLPLEQRDLSSPEWSTMLGETHFAIHRAPQETRGVELGVHIPELEKFVRKLEAKGVRIVSPVQEYPWAKSAEIHDPQGNVIYLMELPKSSLQAIARSRTAAFAET